MDKCHEEFDNTVREAHFGLLTCDLKSAKYSPRGNNCPVLNKKEGKETDHDPIDLQHWALVVHFPRGVKTFLFEAGQNQDRKLEPGRGEVDIELYNRSIGIGTCLTSPRQLLEIACSLPFNCTEYSVLDNNCQVWAQHFIKRVSPTLAQQLKLILSDKRPGSVFDVLD